MRTRLVNFLDSIRTSFWFVPGLMVISMLGLSFILIFLDKRIDLESYNVVWLLFSGGPDGARSVLTTIAGSMITVAGVIFSITIVSLTLASGQFGPRLLRNFMRDLGNQIVLGTFVATFIYCLIILGTITSIEGRIFIPTLSINFALILTLANVGILIYFIHHVSTSIQVESVIYEVYCELLQHLKRLFPEELGHSEKDIENTENTKSPESWKKLYVSTREVESSKDGYLQAIDNDRIFELTVKQDILINIHYRPGEYICNDSRIVTIWFTGDFDESCIKKIADSFIVGSQRTSEQDAEFAIHQLVEIAVRALSPGVNDPNTAISCIDRLTSALCELANRKLPSPFRYDKKGKLRIITEPVDFTGITNAAFDQIRQHGRSDVSVSIRLLEGLARIARSVNLQEHRLAILRQAKMIGEGNLESIPEDNDKQDLQQRYSAFLDTLEEYQCSKR